MKKRNRLFGAMVVVIGMLALGCGAGAEEGEVVNPLSNYSAPNNAIVGSANGVSVTKGEMLKVMWMREAPGALDRFLPLRLVESEAAKTGVSLSEADLAQRVDEAVKRSNASNLQEVVKRFNMTEYTFVNKVRILALTEMIVRRKQGLTTTDISKETADWYKNLTTSAKITNSLKPVGDTSVLAGAWKSPDNTVVGKINSVKVTRGELLSYMWMDHAKQSLREYLIEKLIEQAAVQDGVSVTQQEIDQKTNETLKRSNMESLDQLLERYNLTRDRFVASTRCAALVDKIVRRQVLEVDPDANDQKVSAEAGKFSGQLAAIVDKALNP